jgi:hypothetical protein
MYSHCRDKFFCNTCKIPIIPEKVLFYSSPPPQRQRIRKTTLSPWRLCGEKKINIAEVMIHLSAQAEIVNRNLSQDTGIT